MQAVYAQVTGIAEASKGTWDGASRRIALRSSEIANATKARDVQHIHRSSGKGPYR